MCKLQGNYAFPVIHEFGLIQDVRLSASGESGQPTAKDTLSGYGRRVATGHIKLDQRYDLRLGRRWPVTCNA